MQQAAGVGRSSVTPSRGRRLDRKGKGIMLTTVGLAAGRRVPLPGASALPRYAIPAVLQPTQRTLS